MAGLYLVPVKDDLRIRRLVFSPVTIAGFDENGRLTSVKTIEKTAILCDICNSQVATSDEEAGYGLPVGYAVCDGDCLLAVVCEECRNRYFRKARVYRTLEEAESLGDG